MNISLSNKVLVSALAVLVLLVVMPKEVRSAEPKILIITDGALYRTQFETGVATYGTTTMMLINVASNYSINDLSQYDVIVATDREGNAVWGVHPDLISKIGTLIDEGKSLIVLKSTPTYEGGAAWPSPADAWVSSTYVSTPLGSTDYVVVSSNLTQGIRGIEGSLVAQLFLYGGYPLILSPQKEGYPDPQGALAVHGYYGLGKYAVLSYSLFDASVTGDVGVLFSNIMHWLTDREIPPPPTVVEIDQRIMEMNDTLNSLNTKLTELNSSLDQLMSQIPQLGDIQGQISQLNSSINEIPQLGDIQGQISQLNSSINEINKALQNEASQTSLLNELLNQVAQLRNQQQNLPIYLSTAAVVLGIIAIIVAFVRKPRAIPFKQPKESAS